MGNEMRSVAGSGHEDMDSRTEVEWGGSTLYSVDRAQ